MSIHPSIQRTWESLSKAWSKIHEKLAFYDYIGINLKLFNLLLFNFNNIKTAQNKVDKNRKNCTKQSRGKKQNRWDVEFVSSISLAIELAQALVFV